jgi:hypothetical protein
MRCEEVYAALGLDPKARLPDAGVEAQLVQGISVKVQPKAHGSNQDGNRVRAQCPDCRGWFGFARLRQHVVVHGRAG